MARNRTGPEERKAFHSGRIDGERNGARRFWLAACWVAAELAQLVKRDQAKAHAIGLDLAKQMRGIAADLNDKHQKYLEAQKGGASRV
ncbi:hypothetical protein B0I32_106211 [Nonomuraea fuscirosea]|uniref:Uncharacterized protein n=1 Tax=Nonomuraea fuscirosea TaxID=1291556 RepID=A0A2T0N299_9ACTN|nr:hypothetical protein [Nonomuraea fuscirosea]PRX66075.1 hypothetical protein B0I32_106211 [Nonomuraea fuscirosea]